MTINVEHGVLVEDPVVWYRAWLDTPLTMPRGMSADAAFKTPGACVKTRERIPVGQPMAGFPVTTGKLVSYGEDECIVRGHGDFPGSPKFVWKGSKRQYHATWEVD